MKCLLAVGLVAVVLYQVFGEECTFNDDCSTTICADGHNPICEHPEDAGVTEMGGLCTCSTSDSCVTRDECLSPAHPELDCDDDSRHCYDSLCICTRFPDFGGGGAPFP